MAVKNNAAQKFQMIIVDEATSEQAISAC